MYLFLYLPLYLSLYLPLSSPERFESSTQVQLLITDFFDTGIDDGYDNADI